MLPGPLLVLEDRTGGEGERGEREGSGGKPAGAHDNARHETPTRDSLALEGPRHVAVGGVFGLVLKVSIGQRKLVKDARNWLELNAPSRVSSTTIHPLRGHGHLALAAASGSRRPRSTPQRSNRTRVSGPSQLLGLFELLDAAPADGHTAASQTASASSRSPDALGRATSEIVSASSATASRSPSAASRSSPIA